MRPVVPGYEVGELLGRGGTGAVWAATDPAGEDVAVKVLTASAAAVLGNEVAVLEALQHPAVVRLRAVVATSTGTALVLDLARGGSLTGLVAARGPLPAGEVVTVLAALGAALAELGARGLVHGDITPANVLLTERGRPQLSDWGLSSVVGAVAAARSGPPSTSAGDRRAARHCAGSSSPVDGTPGYADPGRLAGAPSSPAGDVHGLAATAWFALTGAPPPGGSVEGRARALVGVPDALAELLVAATDPRPDHRPSAAALGRRAWEAVAATPIVLPVGLRPVDPVHEVTHRLRLAAAEDPSSDPPPPRRARRVLVAAGAAVAAGLAGAAVAVSLPRAGPGRLEAAGPPASRPASAASAVAAASSGVAASGSGATALAGSDPAAAVLVLARRRAQAFAGADPEALTAVDVPGSPPATADGAALARLVAAGAHLRGLRYDVRSAEVVHRTGSQAWVRVVVVTSAHQVVRGGSSTPVGASGPVTSLLLLSREDGAWRVAGSG